MLKEITRRLSSDKEGPIQEFEVLKAICADHFPLFQGIELIAAGNLVQLDEQLALAAAQNLHNNSIHAATHGQGVSYIDRMFVSLVDVSMPPIDELLRHFHDREILFHAPAINHYWRQIVANPPKLVWVENDSGPDFADLNRLHAAEDAVRRLRDFGINAAVMLDWCHEIGAKALRGNEFYREFDLVVDYYDSLDPAEKMVQGFHVSVGKVKHDCFAVDNPTIVPDSILETIGCRITNTNSPITTVVIEDPQPLTSMVRRDYINKNRQRADVIYNRLYRTGIIG